MPKPRKWLAIALAVASVILGLSFFQTEILFDSWDRRNAILAIFDPARSNVNDPLPAIDAARHLLEAPGAPLYDLSEAELEDRSTFLYPPIAAALYVPIVGRGAGVWDALFRMNRALFVIVVLLAIAIATERRRWPTWIEIGAGVLAVLAFLPIVRALELNQAQLFVTAALGATFVALDRGAPSVSGVAFACACAVKPHLALVLPLVAWRARRFVLASVAAGAALLAASIAWAGWENHVTYVAEVLPIAARGYAFFPNQSFGGLFQRWFSSVPIDVFELAPPNAAVERAVLLCGFTAYAIAAAIFWRARRSSPPPVAVLSFAWIVVTVIAPIAWSHHFAPAIFVFAWLVREIRRGITAHARALDMIALGAGYALLGGYFVVGQLEGRGLRLLASYGLLGALALAVVVVRLGVFGSRAVAASSIASEDEVEVDDDRAAPESAPSGDASRRAITAPGEAPRDRAPSFFR